MAYFLIALAISSVAATIMFYFYRIFMVWWEYLVIYAIPIVMMLGAKSCTEKYQTNDIEYWGGWITSTNYEEPWDEKVSCSHPKYCTRPVIRTDAKGRTSTGTETYRCGDEHLFDVDRHPARWYNVSSNNDIFFITESSYREHVSKFGAAKFVELHRNYYSYDGDRYTSIWNGDLKTIEPAFVSHTYENRVQASSSIFNYPEVSEEDRKAYALFDYPIVSGGYRLPSVLGDAGPTTSEFERAVSVFNALYGKKKQIRVWVLFFKNQTIEAGRKQEAFWKNGNKNEFVITIGLDSANRVMWCYPFSWSESSLLKVESREEVLSQKNTHINLPALSYWIEKRVPELWIRKQFVEFSYLSVDPPLWATLLATLLSICAVVGICYWSVINEFDPGSSDRGSNNDIYRYVRRWWW